MMDPRRIYTCITIWGTPDYEKTKVAFSFFFFFFLFFKFFLGFVLISLLSISFIRNLSDLNTFKVQKIILSCRDTCVIGVNIQPH